MGGNGATRLRVAEAGRALAKRTATAWDRVQPPARGVVVLIYHRVGRRSSLQVDLPTWLFAEHMARLAAAGRVASLEDALALLKGGALSGPNPVVVTFDDGTADFADEALPILVAHQIPATLYVATDFIDRGRPFPAGGAPLSWGGLAEAVSTGLVTVGSHTHTHTLLDRLPPSQVAGELDRSIDLIGEHLGVPPRHFAYPKALAGSPKAEAEVRDRFASAALAGTRPNLYGATDPYRLARSPIQVSDGLRWFTAKAAGGMGAEDRLRAMVNRRRYAGVAN
jgi:peptidoglycan/xylan/chitin deacetylase (PgdA/CDA1 family)